MLRHIEIKNVKRISFLDFKNEDGHNLIKVSGKNAQGKTSVLQAIELALSGRHGLIEHALKEGEEEGYAIVETDEIKAKRKIWKDKYGAPKSELIVWDKTAGGKIVQSPKTFLKQLFGKSFFRPEEFINDKPKGRVETLKEALGLDFTDLDNEKIRLMAERKETGQEKKLTEGQLRAYNHLPTTPPASRNVDEIIKKINEIEKLFERERNEAEISKKENKEYETKKDKLNKKILTMGDFEKSLAEDIVKLEVLQNSIKTTENIIAEYRKQIKEDKATVTQLSKDIKKGYKVSKEDIANSEMLRAELKEASVIDKTFEEFKMRDRINNNLIGLAKKYKQLTNKIDAIDGQKKKILADTEFPVPGMTFGEEDIELNGVPFWSLSTAEKIKISIGVAVKINNEIKFICLEEGSALDENSMAELEALAQKEGYTIFVELVERNENNAMLIISEGRIKE